MTTPGGLLLRDVRVVDVDAARSGDPVDVRVVDGVITEVAPRLAPRPGHEVASLGGRWLLPGLWDAHVHMSQWALTRRRLDVSAARSAAEAARLVVTRLTVDPPPAGATLVAAGFRDGLWSDEPTAALLDGAIADAGLPPAPVVLVSADVHCAWFSSVALERVGAGGHPTGLLREGDWMPLMGQVDQAPAAVLDAWVDEAARAAAARGVVGVVDVELADNLTDWRRRVAGGTTAVRVAAAAWPEHLDAAIDQGLSTGDVVAGTDGLLTMGPLKVIVDGSLNTRTAFCHHPYPPASDGTTWHGALNVEPGRLRSLMSRAREHGIACAIHAIGDRATGVVLDAFAATGAVGSIEHVQLITDDDAARLAALGVVASVQPEHAMDDRDVADRHWAGRTGRAFAYGTLVRAGARLALGSDAPVAALDPWAAIAAAVERSRDGRAAWHPEQRIGLPVALASSVRSRVAVGQPADLAVLDADPCHPETDLRHLPVTATLLNAHWTHRTAEI